MVLGASKLVPTALHLTSTPASQAFVERVFSLCGMLMAARHSSMRKSVDMRAFL